MRAVWPVLLLLAAALPLAHGQNVLRDAPGVPPDGVVVAVLDTGIDPAHPEFAPDQVVAWWDFTVDRSGSSAWMTARAPLDLDGHGTATASLVGGRTAGAFPGVRLAVAKIASDQGTISMADVTPAIRWAVDVAGADVISMSFGPVAPEVGKTSAVDEAVRDAADSGVLSVASAGNGAANLGVKLPSETRYPSGAPDALTVGATSWNGHALYGYFDSYYSNLDPDVAAWGTSVRVAEPGGGYVTQSGTSFSTPLVAGWSARVMKAAIDAGEDASARRVKDLLIGTARDSPLVPYAVEGRGFVNGFSGSWNGRSFAGVPDTVAAAIGHARNGTAPEPPGVSEATLAGGVSTALREALADDLDGEPWFASEREGDAPLRLETSAGAIRDAERWRIPLSAGQTLEVRIRATTVPVLAIHDANLYVLRPGAMDDGLFGEEDVLAASEQGTQNGIVAEGVRLTARFAGTYEVLVSGLWIKPEGLRYQLTVVTVDGAPATLEYAGDQLHVAMRGLA